MTTTIWAMTAESGTAAAETAVCDAHKHLTASFLPDHDPSDPVKNLKLVDCSENEALSCMECGAVANPIHLKLEIDNFYEDGDNITTHAEVDVPPMPFGDDEIEEWEQEHIFPTTGTGNPNGSSAYFVEVLESDSPLIPVGTEWEFGL